MERLFPVGHHAGYRPRTILPVGDGQDAQSGVDERATPGSSAPRRLSVPLWAAGLVAVLVSGLAGGLIAVIVAGDESRPAVPANDTIGSTSSRARLSTTELESMDASTTTTTVGTTVSAPVVTMTPTTLPEPRGTLAIVGPPAGPEFGQGIANGSCATWELLFENNSNTEIVQVVYAPASGGYSNFAEFDPETQQHAPDIPAEPPAPAVLDVSIPPYGQQIMNLETCTTTPPPANTNYQYSATVPEDVTFTWVSGHEGTAELVF